MKIGAQLYTLRKFCDTPEHLSESLARVADIGYTAVQLSGVCPYDAEWMKGELAKNGLACTVTHIAPDRLQRETDLVIKEHDIFGCSRVGLGMFVFNEAEEGKRYEDFIRLYRPVAEKLRAGGKYFMYHNHDGEFQKIGDKLILEKLAEDFAPDELGFILDTYWVQAGGGDPAQWIEKLSGRLPVIHLKDFAYGRKMAPIGKGNINFDRVFEKAAGAGVAYMLVEQDTCYDEDPFDCLKQSYNFLVSRGFQ